MKLLFLLTFTVFFSLSANVFSQDQVLTLRTKGMTLHDLFKEIEKQSNYRFFYNDELVGVNKTVSIDVEGQGIDAVLNKLLANTDLKYRRMENNLIVVSSSALLQQITITGTVSDNGEPLPGVNVMVKGTMIGVVTDARGKFSITVPNKEAVLVFSFVGYTTTEMQVGDQRSIDIELAEDTKSIEEVVVVGYGSQRKSDLTGSIVSVKGNELTQLPTMRPDAALQGRAAGVMIQNTDGAPGGNVNIRIRGGNSISGGNNALVVVDGMQGADISLINPNDIESMEVLKDASATAIYGARGANGVIMITTKRGSSGKPTFSYDYNIGFQQLSHKIDLLNAAEYAQKSNDYADTQNREGGVQITPVRPFTDEQIKAFARDGGTDWQDEIYRTGIVQKHQLSMSGGGEKIKYFVSGAYLDQEGILIGSKYQRYNLRSNLDATLTSWLNAGVSLNMMKAKGNVPPVGEGTYYGDILGQVINLVNRADPCTPVYDETGAYNFKSIGGQPNSKPYADMDVWNPVATALETYNVKNTFLQEANVFLEFKIVNGLTFRVTGAAAISNDDYLKYHSTKTQPGVGTRGRGNTENSSDQYFQNTNILTYSNIFGDHRLTVMGVAEQQLNLYKDLALDAQGFFSDDTGIKDLGAASQINEKSSSYSKKAMNSWLGRVNYAYKDRYIFTGSIRADGSSVFGANNKWGYFPSASVAWNVAEENFLKNLTVISLMKLRGSWGQAGNQGISPYQTLPTVGSGYDYAYRGTGSREIGYRLTRAANPNLKWETTTQTDLGVDLGFFHQRLTLTVDLYKKITKDLLLSKDMPFYTGFANALYNVGSIENKGLEISVTAVPVVSKDVRWSTSANISFNRSKVLKLASDLPLAMRTNPGGGYGFFSANNYALKQLVVGQPVEQMYGFVCLGTWNESERAEAYKYGQVPGDAKWLDVPDAKGDIDTRIRRQEDGNQVIGNPVPKFYYGWNNNISYKWFNLSFLIQGSYGNDIFNAVRIKIENPSNGTGANLKDRWTPTHQNTMVPGFISAQDRFDQLVGAPAGRVSLDNRSSRWIEDGTYVRLKNVTLSYNLPSSITNALRIEKLSVYVSGANLITITNYSGYDPEVSSFNKTSGGTGGLGIDLSNYPTARTYSFGVNLIF